MDIMVMGRPMKFSNPTDLLDKFHQWQEEFRVDGLLADQIPDVEGFCDYIGAWRDLLIEYEKKDNFSDTIKEIKNWIYFKKKQLAMQNKMPAAIFIFDAINNTSYSNKTEVDQNISGKLDTGIQDPATAAEFTEFMKGKTKQ